MLSRVLSKSTTLRSTPALSRTLSSGRELFTDSGSEESGKWLREHILRQDGLEASAKSSASASEDTIYMSHQDATESRTAGDSYFTSAADSPVASSKLHKQPSPEDLKIR